MKLKIGEIKYHSSLFGKGLKFPSAHDDLLKKLQNMLLSF